MKRSEAELQRAAVEMVWLWQAHVRGDLDMQHALDAARRMFDRIRCNAGDIEAALALANLMFERDDPDVLEFIPQPNYANIGKPAYDGLYL